MSTSILVRLPAELVLEIMTQVTASKDLLAFISTTRRFHDVFQSWKNLVLSSVVQNGLSDENFRIAAATCHAAEISKQWALQPFQPSTELQIEFFRSHPGGALPRFELSQHSDLILPLYKLWNSSNHFISKFISPDDQFSIGEHFTIGDLDSPRDLSRDEQDRLQRGFFLFEMYRRCAPAPFHSNLASQGACRAQQKVFLKEFPPWEREQMATVEEFLHDYAAVLVNDSVKFKVDTATNYLKNKAPTPGEAPVAHRTVAKAGPRRICPGHLDQPFLSITDLCTKLAGRGFIFLRWLETLEPRAKLHVIESMQYATAAETIIAVMGTRSMMAELDQHDIQADWSARPSPGWLWAESNDLTLDEPRYRFELRRKGYVFWDASRLALELKYRAMPWWDHDQVMSPRRDVSVWRSVVACMISKRFDDLQVPGGISSADRRSISHLLRPDAEWIEKWEMAKGEGRCVVLPSVFPELMATALDIEYELNRWARNLHFDGERS